MRWLADEISPDTYLNLMSQYRPDHRVGAIGRDGRPKYSEIDRCPTTGELEAAHRAARAAGLWRFDPRV